MSWPRKIGVSLIVTGAVLCGVYLVPTVYGSAMSHLAVARFRSQSTTNSLWDSARIRAYERTLNLSFPAPEAILRVPRLGIEVPVLEGTSDITLNRGVGHIAGTALPGQPGNIAITGHRDGFFRPLKDAREGDIIEVQRKSQTDRYIVSKIKIVFPSDTSVLNNTTDPTLTLVTCYPFYFVGAAPQRYIIQASLLPPTPTSTTVTPAPKSSGD
jgi:sortase A